MTPKAIEGRLRELFSLADLWDRARDPVKDYSFGMRRKLTLLEALCHDPELLILDEPTAGVDAHFLNRLADLVRARTKRGLTTWIAGNDPDWISGVTTGLAFMDSGRIMAMGTEEEFLKELSPLQQVRVRLRGYVDLPNPSIKGCRSFEQSGRNATFILEKDPMIIPLILEWIVSQGIDVSGLDVRQGTLREAFLIKTGEGLSV